jgi:hypothetical protein
MVCNLLSASENGVFQQNRPTAVVRARHSIQRQADVRRIAGVRFCDTYVSGRAADTLKGNQQIVACLLVATLCRIVSASQRSNSAEDMPC